MSERMERMKHVTLEEAQLLFDLGVTVHFRYSSKMYWGGLSKANDRHRPGHVSGDEDAEWAVAEDE